MTCIGCDEEIFGGSMFAVLREGDEWSAEPVCLPCWRDPAHRKRQIKGHFFHETQADAAIDRAVESSNSAPGSAQGLSSQ